MNLSADLNQFNRRIAEALRNAFAHAVHPVQAEDGTLLFRGPVPTADDPKHIGTHVAVSLQGDVIVALAAAPPEEREEMLTILVENLTTQIEALYNPSKIGLDALDIVGTMRILRG